jgi:hypothetical protein
MANSSEALMVYYIPISGFTHLKPRINVICSLRSQQVITSHPTLSHLPDKNKGKLSLDLSIFIVTTDAITA